MEEIQLSIYDGAVTLDDYKHAKNAAIDKRTQELIYNGFTYNSVVYSLSENAQNNLLGAYISRDAMVYPQPWNSKDDTSVLQIADATEMAAFYSAALLQKVSVQNSGTVLKDLVRSAATIDDVKAIVDNR